jgi:hypothetical protein
MIGTNVSGQKWPSAAGTDLLQAFQYDLPAHFIQQVGRLCHSVSRPLLNALVRLWAGEHRIDFASEGQLRSARATKLRSKPM